MNTFTVILHLMLLQPPILMSLVTLLLNTTLSFFLSNGDLYKNGNLSEEEKVIAGSAIMNRVFDRFHINYEMSRTHKIGYYREVMLDSQSVHYLAEGIVDIYVPCNLNQIENASIQPLRTRKKAYKEVDPESILLGNASDMARSSIWRPNSFLNEKNRDNYVFQYLSDSQFNDFHVAVIAFKPANAKGEVSGQMFIDTKSLAIIKIDYTPDATNSDLWSSVSWTEEFRFKNGAFELSAVKFQGFSSENTHQYKATLVMDQLEVINRIPQNDLFINENISLFEEANDDFSQAFWRGYYHLKRLLDTQENTLLAGK